MKSASPGGPGAATRPRELTIGALARRARVATSVLRFYEKEGLLVPGRRTASGYRVYGPEAEKTLLFINRAKRLGFSLEDIRQFLQAGGPRPLPGPTGGPTGDVARIAGERYVDIERRLTELLVLRHELEVFLQDISAQLPGPEGPRRLYQRLVDQVCGHDHGSPQERASSLKELMQRMGCRMGSQEGEVPEILSGRHVHVWREGDGYRVLIPDHDPRIGDALRQIAASEAGCSAHRPPEVEETAEGFVFSAAGDNAFLFAQFFLALEQQPGP